jgi:putative oxidoreductase
MNWIEKLDDNRAMDAFLASGRFLLALPMVIFGIEHFLFANFVTMIVPPWIPWHLFWIYFVGIALIAAGVAIIIRKETQLAGLLLGAMILAFILLIHSRLLAQLPSDLFAAKPIFGPHPGRLNNACKDLGLSGAAFLFAGTQSDTWKVQGKDKVFTLGRVLFAIAVATLGVLHFVYPAFAPGVQPMSTTINFPLPGQPMWSYMTGIAFVAAAVAIFLNNRVRLAATLLGILILLFGLIVWVPWLARHPQDIAGGNYLKDMGLVGGALLLAGALPKKDG